MYGNADYHTFVSYFLVFKCLPFHLHLAQSSETWLYRSVDMLFLMNGFICLFYENKCMLISGSHISNRSVVLHFTCNSTSCAREHACLYHTAGLMFSHTAFSAQIPHLVKTYDGIPCQKKIG